MDIECLVGCTTEVALATIEKEGFTQRVVSKDGVELGRTFDYDERRINLTLVSGQVVKAELG